MLLPFSGLCCGWFDPSA